VSKAVLISVIVKNCIKNCDKKIKLSRQQIEIEQVPETFRPNSLGIQNWVLADRLKNLALK